MKRLLILLWLTFSSGILFAQSTFVPYNRDYYHLIDRFHIRFADDPDFLQMAFKPVRRADLAEFLLSIEDRYDSLSPADKFNFQYLMNDNWLWTNSKFNKNEKHWWNIFYDKKSDFYQYRTEGFNLRLNPVVDFTVGNDTEQDGILYTNTRGVEAIGNIDEKIGFYTFLSTTQARFPEYVHQLITERGAFPNEASWKRFGDSDYDFFHARGYFTFNLTKSIDVQAGYDKQFIGDGLRSMILSDFSSPFLFAKINTRVGRFQYTNLYSQLTADVFFNQGFPAEGTYPTKFFTMHRLGVNITPRLNIGVSEFIVAEEAELEYYNPIIFLRAAELFRGSPNNTLLSLDWSWNIKNSIKFYGQMIIDDFEIDAIRSGLKGWENKFGIQLGAKYIDAFKIPNLDLQGEFNIARPYFYAYEEPAASYTNFRNPLAHPLGANFRELLLVGRYQPFNKVTVTGKIIRSEFGEDMDGMNFGGNPLLDTDTRIGQTGITIGQGALAKVTYVEGVGSYMLLHNMFIDLRAAYRNLNSELPGRSNNSFFTTLTLRWNMAKRQHEF